MAHPLIYPTLGAVAVLGSSLGVYLGRSAIAEINPAYYSKRQTRFHSDLVPYRSFEAARPTLASVETEVALGSGCIGCRTDIADSYPVQETSAGRYPAAYAAGAEPAAEYEPEPSPDLLQRQTELAQVERYSSYPVSHEEGAAYASAATPSHDQREDAPAVD